MKISLIYFFFLVIVLVSAYPGLFHDLLTPAAKQKTRLEKNPPFTYAPLSPNVPPFTLTDPTSMYRENVQRTGVNERAVIDVNLKEAWGYRPLNAGIHTASKSSPAVDESGLYVGSDNSWFYAFEPDGTLRWRFFVSGSGRGIHGTAALDQDHVYFGAYNGSLYCLDKKIGSLVWVVRLGAALGASPVIFGDSLYVGVELAHPVDGFLAKIKRVEGSVTWRSTQMGEQTHSSPTLNMTAELVYSGANNGNFYALDMVTGQTKWQVNLGGAVKSTSTLVGQVLYVTSWRPYVTALDAVSGTVLWERKLQAPSRSSPTFVPKLNFLIIADQGGGIYAVNQKNGDVVWTLNSAIHQMISSALVVKNEKGKYLAWIPCQPKTLCALDPSNGQTLATYPLPHILTGVPVAWKNSLYLALDKTGGLLKLESAP